MSPQRADFASAAALLVSALILVLGGIAGCSDTSSEPVDPVDPSTCVGGKCDSTEREPDTDLGDDREVWVLAQSHLHTTGQHDCANSPLNPGPLPDGACYTSEGITAFLEAALDYGATDMLITDHNNVDAWFDPAFAPLASDDGSRYATPLRGTEWSSGEGHMTVFFPRQVVDSSAGGFEAGWLYGPGNHEDPEDTQVYTDAIDATHEHGGLVVINHPRLLIHPFEEASFGADGVEVGVKVKPGLQASSATRTWWQRRLTSFDRLTAMAGADHHHGGGDLPFLDEPIFGVAVNLMRVDPALPDYKDPAEALADPEGTIDQRSDIYADALRRGHVMVVEDLETPRVYLGADLDGDDRYHDARAGDCILGDRFEGSEVSFRVRITKSQLEETGGHYNALFWTEDDDDSPWFRTRVHSDGFAAPDKKPYTVDPDDAFSATLTMPFDPGRPQFLRVELEYDQLGPYNDTKTVTNPIYFGDWGDECRGSVPLY